MAADEPRQFLAILEAEVGSLFELLPVPLIVTSDTGQILRLNRTAAAFLESYETLVGRQISDVLLGQVVTVRLTTLSHKQESRRLYVLQHPCGACAGP